MGGGVELAVTSFIDLPCPGLAHAHSVSPERRPGCYDNISFALIVLSFTLEITPCGGGLLFAPR